MSVPADERSFSDPLPAQLYIDTDILIAYLVEVEPHYDRCRRFLHRIAESGRTELLVASLTWMEFTNVVMKERFRTRLPTGWQERFALALWEDETVRQRYLESQLDALETLLDQFPWSELSLTPQIRTAATRFVSVHSLRPYDAVHVASALAFGCIDLASFDEAFRRVDGIRLWNDLIHSTRS